MNYQLKIAKIIEPRILVGDVVYNLFRLRILPDMSDIPETQNELLPVFPNFFKQNNTAYQKDDIVWVVCNEDFQVGFILGLAQPPAGDNISSFIDVINKAEEEAGQPFVVSGINDITVVNISGSSLLFTNSAHAQSGQLYNNSTVFLFASDGSIWVKNPGMSLRTSGEGDLTIVGKNKTETLSNSTTSADTVTVEASKTEISTEGVHNLNVGGAYTVTANTVSETSLGSEDHIVVGKQSETIGQGIVKQVISGGEKDTVLLGDYSITVTAGAMNLTTVAGTINMTSGGGVTITAPIVNVVAGAIKFPSVSTPLPSPGPFCMLPLCLFSGAPHTMPGYAGGV